MRNVIPKQWHVQCSYTGPTWGHFKHCWPFHTFFHTYMIQHQVQFYSLTHLEIPHAVLLIEPLWQSDRIRVSLKHSHRHITAREISPHMQCNGPMGTFAYPWLASPPNSPYVLITSPSTFKQASQLCLLTIIYYLILHL